VQAHIDASASERFVALLDAAMREVFDEVLVSQSRCVDHLLDLLNATDNEVLRQLTVDALDDIRLLNVARGVDIFGELAVIAAACNAELAEVHDAEPYAPRGHQM
jgi:hypothetical protein